MCRLRQTSTLRRMVPNPVILWSRVSLGSGSDNVKTVQLTRTSKSPRMDRATSIRGRRIRTIHTPLVKGGFSTICELLKCPRQVHLNDLGHRPSLQRLLLQRTSLWFTMNRVYKWRVEASHEADLTRFVVAAAHLYERLRPGQRIQVTGVTVPALRMLY